MRGGESQGRVGVCAGAKGRSDERRGVVGKVLGWRTMLVSEPPLGGFWIALHSD